MARKGGGSGGDEESILEDVELKRKELENSSLVAGLVKELKKYNVSPKEIRFLAVGNFGLEDRNAEYQTALVSILCDRFGTNKVTSWDPNFKKRDLRVLSSLGMSVKEGDPASNSDLLWFVPHAPYFLEPSLLKRVKHCVYIGNDLTKSDPNTMRDDKECAWYKNEAQISPLKVKPKDPWREAFKNTAIHQLLEEKKDGEGS